MRAGGEVLVAQAEPRLVAEGAEREGGYGGTGVVDSLCLPGLDQEEYPMLKKHLDDAVTFLDQQRAFKRQVLIHCVAGSNRSGVIAVAYLMRVGGMALEDAIRHVVSRRPIVLYNEGFQSVRDHFKLIRRYQSLKFGMDYQEYKAL